MKCQIFTNTIIRLMTINILPIAQLNLKKLAFDMKLLYTSDIELQQQIR